MSTNELSNFYFYSKLVQCYEAAKSLMTEFGPTRASIEGI